MNGFFDFLNGVRFYNDDRVARLNLRHDHIVTPFLQDIQGARVLDLGAHDGRWAYALAAAGAASVVGVEAREELVEAFSSFPEQECKCKVQMVVDDIYQDMDVRIAQAEQFDVVAAYGIFYHISDHYGLLDRITKLKPKLVIIDTEIIPRINNMIQLVRERTDNPLNAIGKTKDQTVTLIGIPSLTAIEDMAALLEYSCEWISWDDTAEDRRKTVQDYFPSDADRIRATCALRPLSQDQP